MARSIARNRNALTWLALAMILVLSQEVPAQPQAAPEPGVTDREITNVAAMTRLLGYVRFFHPLQPPELFDWNAIAIDGARAAADATDADDLAKRLESWIREVAPMVRVRAADAASLRHSIEQAPEEGDLVDARLRARPQDRSVKVLSWLHHGINLNNMRGPYFNRIDSEWFEADEVIPPELDPARPMVLELCEGVCAVVPRCVFDVPPDPRHLPKARDAANVSINDRAVRYAGIAIVWTVLQHFYPYFDVVKTDWDQALIDALRAAAMDSDANAYHDTLRQLIAKLHDGHGGVYHNNDGRWFVPAIKIDRVEGQWLVTASLHPQLKIGDAIRSIDGVPIEELESRMAATVSAATDGWMRHRLAGELLIGTRLSPIFLEVENPTDGARTVRAERSIHLMEMREDRPTVVEEIEPGIWYVDMDRANDENINAVVEELAKAKGVIFDLRGYPRNLSTVVISHLIDAPVTCAQWHVPKVTKPDRVDMDFQFSNWQVQPIAPRFKGNVAFVINGGAISYAETYMGIIEHYKLAEIVGEPTAGTNGNVTTVEIPGGYNIAFTGMKVLKHDGSQHHGIGIIPTVPCSRTIEGVLAGRDELLERAIEVVKQES